MTAAEVEDPPPARRGEWRAAVVVDASLAVKWLVQEAGSPEVIALRDQWLEGGTRMVMPDLALVEVANALWKKVERGLLHPDDPVLRRPLGEGLPLEFVPATTLLRDAMALAVTHHVAVYDAIYVALARHLNAPLFTMDEPLRRRIPGTVAMLRGVE